MKTPDTASALQQTARRAWDILVPNAADGTCTDERYAAWEQALEHFSEGGMPVTAEQDEIADFLALLAGSSITDPMDDDGYEDTQHSAEGDLGHEDRSPVSRPGGYWSRHQAALASLGQPAEHAAAYLDHSSSEVLGHLAEPTRPDAWRSRGLVMGHAGSGKTHVFTALAAKALDAGYRLVIVVSGPQNVQRVQIQQALDAHLVDGEQDPVLRGTTTEHDYRGTGSDSTFWEFGRRDPALPLNTEYNLRHTAPRLLAVKRNASILRRLVRDLAAQGTGLSEVPALVIDDEPDPWSAVNAVRPGHVRPVTSELVSRLLELLPRSQYVNYAWTPFARSLLDPAGEGAPFPADYIIRLPRPDGYLGAYEVSDGKAQVARLWRDQGMSGDDDGSLRQALDMFVLTGAVKLFRQTTSRSYHYRHHTMLVHGTNRTAEQQQLSGRLLRLWEEADYSTGGSTQRLNRLFDTDLLGGAGSYEEGACLPAAFEDLLPYIRDAAERIGSSPSPVAGMRATHRRLWKILVGGSVPPGDLEVEGLTVTHLRQPAGDGAGVRLFGEWFGRHHGYRDLVRMYVQLDAGQDGDWIRAKERFESLCRAEVAFRSQLQAIAASPGADRLRSAELPALAADHLSRQRRQADTGRGINTVSPWHSHRSGDQAAGTRRGSGVLMPDPCGTGSAG
ncbi:Z1 domain-containing protein [Streptomyces aureoversilis]|uniref:Z1 domain-containing protein n=1 Tax=Streptomyces aureoversilis TaxID=67277 RepID=A0ABV9ZWR6_9ACTN